MIKILSWVPFREITVHRWWIREGVGTKADNGNKREREFNAIIQLRKVDLEAMWLKGLRDFEEGGLSVLFRETMWWIKDWKERI